MQYTGPTQITTERAFRLIAEQLPVDVGQVAQTGGRMRLLVKYVASAYVVPANVKAILSVPQARMVRDAQGAWLEVSVRNEGTTRKILTGARLGIGDRVIDTAALKGMAGENILAGTTRTFRIPAPANLAEPLPPVRLLVD